VPSRKPIACGPPRTVLIMPEISALRNPSASTLPRQSLSVDAQTYSAKDENRQHKCKRDGVPIHITLLFGATEPTGAEVRISGPKSRRAKLPRLRARRKWGPRGGREWRGKTRGPASVAGEPRGRPIKYGPTPADCAELLTMETFPPGFDALCCRAQCRRAPCRAHHEPRRAGVGRDPGSVKR
jgi:hypothetical protein